MAANADEIGSSLAIGSANASPDQIAASGGKFVTAELAREYDITDVDGADITSACADRRRRMTEGDRLARLERPADKQGIVECLSRFSRGMDWFDRELCLSAFHPDAEVAAGSFVGNAAERYDSAMSMHEAGQIATYHACARAIRVPAGRPTSGWAP